MGTNRVETPRSAELTFSHINNRLPSQLLIRCFVFCKSKREWITTAKTKQTRGSKNSKNNGDKKGNKGETTPAQGVEKSNTRQTTNVVGCFICNGPYRAKDCPKKERLNALVAEEESEGSELEVTPRMNPLQLLNAIQAQPNHKGLIYIEVELSDQKVVALVDSGATHNFVATRAVTRLGLKLCKDGSKLKVVNNDA